MNTSKKDRSIDLIFCLCLIGILIVYLTRINLGLADKDETFYLSIPYRMIQGDGLLSEEWHLSQLVGFLLYPIMKIYLGIIGNTEGIILNFRYIYLTIHLLTITATYLLLRKREPILALCISTMFGLFTPYGIMALSYNTLGLICVFLISVISIAPVKHKKTAYLAIGLLIAAATLCNPFFAIFYFIYAICVIAANLFNKVYDDLLTWKALIFISIGIGIVAVLFLLEIFSKSSFQEILQNIPLILNSDPEHPHKTIRSFFLPFYHFVSTYRVYFTGVFITLAAGILFKKGRKYCFIIITVLSLALTCYFAFSPLNMDLGYNALMVPLSISGISAFIFSSKKDWNIFIKGILLSVFYALCMHLASDQHLYVMSNALTIASCMSLFLVKDFCLENFHRKILNWKVILIFIMLIQLGSELKIQRTHIFWENNIEELNSEITQGPLKGIYTTESKKEYYEMNCNDIKKLGNLEGKTILFYPFLPYGYYMTNAYLGSYSAWTVSIKDFLYSENLLQYYKLHEDKIPDIIYVDVNSVSYWDPEQWNSFCTQEQYSLEIYPSGSYVLKRQ